MDNNQEKKENASGQCASTAGLGSAFEYAIMNILGPAALTGGKMSHYEVAQAFWNAGLETAGMVCDNRANLCGTRADATDDHDDAIELKARAFQICVLAAEIRKFMKPN